MTQAKFVAIEEFIILTLSQVGLAKILRSQLVNRGTIWVRESYDRKRNTNVNSSTLATPENSPQQALHKVEKAFMLLCNLVWFVGSVFGAGGQ